MHSVEEFHSMLTPVTIQHLAYWRSFEKCSGRDTREERTHGSRSVGQATPAVSATRLTGWKVMNICYCARMELVMSDIFGDIDSIFCDY
ncbi:hypothetical protein AVEN_17096-1 [Araneus ventricosus]|uniref:Uncharacterized protein n=1 Tax=Araneus ventricosus TaxID=182803 RepID=A0A4Y2R2H1_ARAVE|nr:hypothetical protein AVEN_17096-1 [Araneus ventricosus]